MEAAPPLRAASLSTLHPKNPCLSHANPSFRLSAWPSFGLRSGAGPRFGQSLLVAARASAGVRASRGGSIQNSSSVSSESLWSAGSLEGKLTLVLEQVTPVKLVKWTTIGAVVVAFVKFVYGVLWMPSFWMYSSWFFVVWPLPTAIGLGLWSLRAARKQMEGKAKVWEQALILAGALTWLILVPLGHFHGYVDGWPLTLCFIYAWFFLGSSGARLRIYGNLSPRKQEKQWISTPSRTVQIAFIAIIVGGHWLAAKEAPHLSHTWNWQWPSCLASFIFILAVSLHYYASYFLGKYCDEFAVPQTVVIFGPYRFVRHPMYASYMLLFAGTCIALRAYKSMIFLLLACILYYEQRVKFEEKMLIEAFPQLYTSYRGKVTEKFFPLLY